MVFKVGQSILKFVGISEGPRLLTNGTNLLLIDARIQPSESEISAFHSGNSFRYALCEAAGAYFFLYSAGSFAWNDVPILLTKETPADGSMLMVVLVDCTTGTVRAIRMLGLSQEFAISWQHVISTITARGLSQRDLLASVDRAYALFSTNEMVAMADRIYEVHEGEAKGKPESTTKSSSRRSLSDLPASMFHKDDYPGLPTELKEFNYWLRDAGRSILAIPELLLERAEADGNFDLYEVPIPVKYVLEKGYRIYNGYVIVDVAYDHNLGVTVPEEYSEW